jgi:hypothetical protein
MLWTLEDLNPWPSGISELTGIRNATTTPSLCEIVRMCLLDFWKVGKPTFGSKEKIKEGDAYFILYDWEGEESELGGERREGSEARLNGGWFWLGRGFAWLVFLIETNT